MAERDEAYVDQWANARIIGNTKNHCTDGEMSPRDTEGGKHGEQDSCAELQERLRNGVGTSNPRLR